MDATEAATAMAMDAGRSAVAVVRALRAGDHDAAIDLVRTMNAAEAGNLAGALAMLASQCLNAIDNITEYARGHGCHELTQQSDHVLAVLALGFANNDDEGPWKD